MKAFYYFSITLISTFIISCGSNNNTYDSEIFDNISRLNSKYGQFEGSVFIGNNSGTCFIILENGKKIGDDYEKIIRLRYQLYSDIVDETFTVKDMNLYNSKTTDIGLNNPNKYAVDFIKGKFRGLKNSINNGRINDSDSSGEVIFAIDSLGKNLKCVMVGEGNYSYQGNIKLDGENHVSIKKIFNENISKEEEEKIAQSYNKIELISDQLIKTKPNTYILPISINKIYDNGKSFSTNNGVYVESSIDSLFSVKIKNISNSTFEFEINNRFYDTQMSITPEQEVIQYFSRGSSLDGNPDDNKFTSNFNSGDIIDFTFNLNLSSNKVPKRFKDNLGMFDLFNNQEFMNILNTALELPAILISSNNEVISKIYFEFVD